MMHFRRDHRVSLDTNEISLYALCKQARPWHQSRDLCILFHYSSQRGLSWQLSCNSALLCFVTRQPFCGKCSIKSPSILLLVARNQVVVPLIYHLTIFYGPFSIDAVSSRKHFLWTYWGRLSKKAQAISSSFGISKAECFFLCTIFQYQLELGKEHKRYSSHAR